MAPYLLTTVYKRSSCFISSATFGIANPSDFSHSTGRKVISHWVLLPSNNTAEHIFTCVLAILLFSLGRIQVFDLYYWLSLFQLSSLWGPVALACAFLSKLQDGDLTCDISLLGPKIPLLFFSLSSFFFFLDALYDLWNASSPTIDWTWMLGSEGSLS